ncbi:hypothetical protein [Sphaerisporangium sp. NPDC051011]|uniref:nSTAND1 domain-containing NTPase n=1 Tax=Sphaerisporangium sp. NPDC051011 TaxID=3155792 RepID=UPI0033D16EFF
MSRRAHYSATALSEAAGGKVFPTLAVTLAYVRACGGDPAEWGRRWRETAERLAAGDAPGSVAEPGASARDAPYRGLMRFEPEDAARFFGREKLVAELRVYVAGNPFLGIFGPSGSGKSSLLRAGLIPALLEESAGGEVEWLPSLLTPGQHPVEQLAISLANLQGISAGSLHADLMDDPANTRLAIGQILARPPKDARVVIVVDQFEEVFTQCEDEAERVRYIACLLAALEGNSDRVRLVIAARADFYARCAEYPALATVLRDAQWLIGPMDEADLRSVVTGPAEVAGLRLESAFVETILADARGEPGALPLISHALLETWRRRRGNTLTLAEYREAGGIHGAVARTAERVYGALDGALQELARDMFLRLTALGEGTGDTRRRVSLAELLAGPDDDAVRDVLARLTEARLLTVDTDSVQVAHEAIIRSWPRLSGWLTEDRELLRAHRRLTDAALEWKHHRAEESLLYTGHRLAAWDGRPLDWLNQLERGFLAASRKRHARERAAVRRRTRVTLSGLAITLLLVSSLAFGAVLNARQLRVERDTARSRQLAANARGQLPLDPELSVLLARRALEVSPTREADAVLRQAVVESRVRLTLPVGPGKVCGVAFSPDGRHLAASGEDGTVRVWRTTGEGLTASDPITLRGHQGEAWSPVFSPDGRRLATAGVDGTVRVWKWDVGGEPVVLRGHRDAVWNIAFSPDGRRLASAGQDGTIRIWDAEGKAEPVVLRGHKGRALGVAFSPDGRHVASGGGDGTVRVWDLRGEAQPLVLRGHTNSVEDVAFSPDGRRVASASTDGTARVWDVAGDGDPLVLRGHDGTVEGVTFSPDGYKIATVSNDATVRVWSSTDALDPRVLRGHRGTVWAAAFGPAGRTMATASDDGTVRIWDVRGPEEVVLRGHAGPVWSGAFDPAGRHVAGAGADGTVRLWDWASGRDPVVLRGHHGEVLDVVYGPDGRRVASAGDDGTVRIWDVTGKAEPVVLRGHQGAVWNAAFSPDGRRVVSGGNDGTVRIWDVAGGAGPVVLRSGQGVVRSVAFSPDGRRVVSGGNDGTVRIWDVTGKAEPVVLRGHQGLVWTVEFSPDGRYVASGGNDGTVRIWDVTGKAEPVVLRGHQGIVWTLSFSPDGRLVATGGNDNSVRIWQSAGDGEPLVFRGHGASVESVAFGRDGRLVTTHDDATVRVWRCAVCGPIEDVLTLASARTRRRLTAEESRLYRSDP